MIEPDDKYGISRDRNMIACVALLPMVAGNVLSMFGRFSDGPQVMSILLGAFAIWQVAPRRK